MGLLLWCMWSTFHILSRSVVFYVYGSVHPWSILIIVQRDATQSSLFIILHTVHVSGVNRTHHQEYTKL